VANEREHTNLRPDDIARPKSVIHPALDWVGGQLVVGVVFEGNHRAVLCSRDGLVEISKIGRVCERDGNFESHVTPEIARAFIAHLETKPRPCPKEELNALLKELADYYGRFVVFPQQYWPTVMAAWTLGTYLFPVFQAYPYLWLTSSEPGCGKSLLGQMLANLSFNGEFMTSPTEANMFHLPEQNRGVQVWDEVELGSQVERGRFQSVKAILLNGYRNGGAVPRQVGKNWDQQVKYHVYCPRVLIGLSDLPETAQQRSIRLALRKRDASQKVPLYRVHDQSKEETEVRGKCILTALKCAEAVNEFYQDNSLRAGLETLMQKAGREVDDIWLPLFAIVASPSPDPRIDPKQNSLLGDLARAAQQAATLPADSDRKVSADSPAFSHKNAARQITLREPDAALLAALDMLGWGQPCSPSDLAERVSERLGSEVTTQWLSKHLKRIGIRAKKQKGRRVFAVTPNEVEAAKRRLGIVPHRLRAYGRGRLGQEGQQSYEKARLVQPVSTEA
jgi:hypothetical protein